MNFLQYQIQSMYEGMQRPEGVLFIAVFLLLAVMTFAAQWMRWVLLALMLYVCTFGMSTYTGLHLAFPLQQIRSFGRGICGVLLVMMLVPTIRSNRGWRRNVVMGGLLAFFAWEIVAILHILFTGDFARGYFGIITYTLTLLTLGVGLSRWLQDPDNAIAAVRAMVGAGALFCISGLYQWVINPSEAIWADRFMGITGNANHSAMILAAAIPPTVYLFLRSGGVRAMRIFTAALTAVMVVMLMWTGSRTGFVVAVFGLVMLFRLRLGKMAVAIVCCGVFAFLMLSILNDSGILTIAGRLTSFDDTRSAAWASMYDQFRSSPLIGVSGEEAAFSENSYLLVLSRTGIVGALPFAISVVLVLGALIRLQRLRPYLGDQVLLADLATAGIGSLALGAMFEGYLYATYSFPLFALWVYAGLALFAIDYGQARAYQMQFPEEWEDQPLLYEEDQLQIPAYEPAPREEYYA